jgi:hypothetical protein
MGSGFLLLSIFLLFFIIFFAGLSVDPFDSNFSARLFFLSREPSITTALCCLSAGLTRSDRREASRSVRLNNKELFSLRVSGVSFGQTISLRTIASRNFRMLSSMWESTENTQGSKVIVAKELSGARLVVSIVTTAPILLFSGIMVMTA